MSPEEALVEHAEPIEVDDRRAAEFLPGPRVELARIGQVHREGTVACAAQCADQGVRGAGQRQRFGDDGDPGTLVGLDEAPQLDDRAGRIVMMRRRDQTGPVGERG
jgi:hypothetical protein